MTAEQEINMALCAAALIEVQLYGPDTGEDDATILSVALQTLLRLVCGRQGMEPEPYSEKNAELMAKIETFLTLSDVMEQSRGRSND